MLIQLASVLCPALTNHWLGSADRGSSLASWVIHLPEHLQWVSFTEA